MKLKIKTDINEVTAPFETKISNDRVASRPDHRVDPAREASGVFALLDDDEMSEAERQRYGKQEEAKTIQAEKLEIVSQPTLFDRIKNWFR